MEHKNWHYYVAALIVWFLGIWLTAVITLFLPLIDAVTWNEWRWAIIASSAYYAHVISRKEAWKWPTR